MTNIDKQDAQHVLAYFGAGGMSGGSFSKQLIHTYSLADDNNRARLAIGFPSMAAAFDLVQNSLNGISELQKIAQA